jgi:hypothetical protein
MRTVRTKVYQFNELSEQAKENAIEWFLSGNESFAFSDTVEDAEQIGLIITSLEDHRPNKGSFEISAPDTAERIIENHGEHCETYKTAKQFIADLSELTGKYEDIEDCPEDEIEELEDDFLKSILEDYRIICNNQIDYENTDKYAIDGIIANEYEFQQDGTMF